MTSHSVTDTPPRSLAVIRLVQGLTAAGALFLLVLPPLFWARADWVMQLGPAMAGIGTHPVHVGGAARAWGAAVSLPLVGLGLFALWQLWRLFAEYAHGRALGQPALRHLRRFAWSVLATALLQPLAKAALSVALTVGNPPGQRLLSLSLGSSDYLALLLGAVLLAVAQVMHQAVLAAEENRGFV